MTRNIVILLVIVFLVAAIGYLVYPAQARADGFSDVFDYHTSRHRVVKRAKYRKHTRYYAPPPSWRDEDEERGAKCLSEPVKVISTEHTSKENAMEAAKKMWSFNVQWEKGSRFMDLDLAADYREYCGQSNAMDTASGRINEAVNQLAGREGVNVRCVIQARPCRAILERAEGHR